jgi:hypothetical protein
MAVSSVAMFLGAAPAVKYRYFRLSMTLTAASSFPTIQELEVVAGGIDYPVSAMTANNAPSPLVASASTAFSASFAAWYAFDNNVAASGGSAMWIPSATANGSGVCNEWLKIDLGSGNGIAPTGYKITPDITGNRNAPYTFLIEGSNDDSAWTTLASQSSLSAGWSAGVARSFSI